MDIDRFEDIRRGRGSGIDIKEVKIVKINRN
jgi:hypothetical protein